MPWRIILPIILEMPEEDDNALCAAKRHRENTPHVQWEARNELYSHEYYQEQEAWLDKVDPNVMINAARYYEHDRKLALEMGCGSGWFMKRNIARALSMSGSTSPIKRAFHVKNIRAVQQRGVHNER